MINQKSTATVLHARRVHPDSMKRRPGMAGFRRRVRYLATYELREGWDASKCIDDIQEAAEGIARMAFLAIWVPAVFLRAVLRIPALPVLWCLRAITDAEGVDRRRAAYERMLAIEHEIRRREHADRHADRLAQHGFVALVHITGSTVEDVWKKLTSIYCDAHTAKQDFFGGRWPEMVDNDDGRIEVRPATDAANPAKGTETE